MARTPYSLNSYTGGAGAAYLTGSGIGAADTTITITGTNSGWNPLGAIGGWYLDIDYGTANEEKVFVASGTYSWASGLVTISGITRGIDETAAVVHSGGGMPNGVVCTPSLTSIDTSEANHLVAQIITGSGNPNSVLTPTVSGQIYIDIYSPAIYQAYGFTNTSWGNAINWNSGYPQISTPLGGSITIYNGEFDIQTGYTKAGIIIGAGSPAGSAGTSYIGSLYIDNTNGALWQASVAGFPATWFKLGTFSTAGLAVSGVLSVSPPTPYNVTNNSGTLSVGGAIGFSDFNLLASLVSSGNNYNQMTIQNTTSGTLASTSYVANNNLATSGTYFAEFGINSSAFSGTGVFNTPNASYLAASSGELGVGTYNGGGLHLVVSGVEALVISGTGQSIGVNFPTFHNNNLTVSGNTTLSGTNIFFGTNTLSGTNTLYGTTNHIGTEVITNLVVSGSITVSGNYNPTYDMPPSYVAPYKSWTMDPAFASNNVTLVTGTAYYFGIWVPQPITLSGISFYSTTFAATDTAYLGFFNATTQLAVCSGFVGGTTGLNKCLISGGTYQVTTPGLYYVGLVISGSTTFILNGSAGVGATILNLGVTNQTNAVTGLRVGSVVIGQRALYSNSTTISGSTQPFGSLPFFALS